MISSTKGGEGASIGHRQAVTSPSPSRVVPKPLPQSQVKDARGYQIEQLKRRFSPKESILDNATTSLVFKLAPSDPDFPFELAHLECDVRVPASYPRAPPTLRVLNKDVPRGFGINIEKGWDKLVQEKKGATLLALTNALDRNLESFLSEQKTETVKVTIFKDTRHVGASGKEPLSDLAPTAAAVPSAERRYVPEESYSKDDIAAAKARRAQEVRQLEARMGRDPLYHRSSDGIVYTLPIEPKRRSELPVGLQTVRSFQLIVPLLYPLQAIHILLNDVDSQDAEGTEGLFSERAVAQKQMTLMSHINSLAQNLHTLARQAQARTPAATLLEASREEKPAQEENSIDSGGVKDAKSHIKVIPRPPEWGHTDGSDESDEDDSYESDESDDGGVALEEGGTEAPTASSSRPERGTAISFPSVQLHGVELLEVSLLSLSIKCVRCKTINELTHLQPNLEKASSCRKCATPFAVRFRPEPVHAHSVRAGFVDAAGCTVADLLPSTFVPTCGRCSTPTATGFVSVRGETTTNVCRECHARFTFALPEVRFLAYAPGSALAAAGPAGPRRRQEKLGLHAGEPLPDRGACRHYKRSHRWFRFTCCAKVYACDRCHDEGEAHGNEWANRMICGWCSREQNYAVESCQFCGRSVIGRRGNGYWEGGKGTRNRVLMRRGDKRKHRRVGPSEAKKTE